MLAHHDELRVVVLPVIKQRRAGLLMQRPLAQGLQRVVAEFVGLGELRKQPWIVNCET